MITVNKLITFLENEKHHILNRFSQSHEYGYENEICDTLVEVAKTIKNGIGDDITMFKDFINRFNKAINEDNIISLTLLDDEFEQPNNENEIIYNLRNPYIYKVGDIIYNKKTYKIVIKNIYDIHGKKITKKEKYKDIIKSIENEYNPTIYIKKNDTLSDNKINSCIIRKEVVEKKHYNTQSVVIINADLHMFRDVNYKIGVNINDKKLKSLMDFYKIKINDDN